MQKEIILFGKNGQVGSNIINNFSGNNKFCLKSFGRSELDFSFPKKIIPFLENLKDTPYVIINACAYTNVDGAEAESDLAYKINAESVRELAKFCQKKDVVFMHYSTDYVFDGKGEEPYTENNIKNLNPLNEYGKSKLLGEKYIQEIGGKYLIFRTSGVYDEHNKSAKNFVNTMKRLFKEREEISVVSDQIVSPTSAQFIAKKTLGILDKLESFEKFPSGIYHMVEDEFMSWYDFANKIWERQKELGREMKLKKINAISLDQFKAAAKRPKNERLKKSDFI